MYLRMIEYIFFMMVHHWMHLKLDACTYNVPDHASFPAVGASFDASFK
jgi:hypothetical protein